MEGLSSMGCSRLSQTPICPQLMQFPWISAIKLSLSFLTCTHLDTVSTRNIPQFTKVRNHRKLVHHLDCGRLLSEADIAYAQACDYHPVKWFIAASSDKDIEGGREALLCCGEEGRPMLTTGQIFSLSWKIDKDWRHPFM